MTTFRIKNLKIMTIVGTNDSERIKEQEVVINISFDVDTAKACRSDDLKETVNYRGLTKKIISKVEGSRFYLLEKLADFILKVVLEDKRILNATVEVDKPGALRFAQSVSAKASSQSRP